MHKTEISPHMQAIKCATNKRFALHSQFYHAHMQTYGCNLNMRGLVRVMYATVPGLDCAALTSQTHPSPETTQHMTWKA